jgi:hypothetical protein
MSVEEHIWRACRTRAAEAATGLITTRASWLDRKDFSASAMSARASAIPAPRRPWPSPGPSSPTRSSARSPHPARTRTKPAAVRLRERRLPELIVACGGRVITPLIRQSYGGTSEIMKTIIAREVTGLRT